MARPVTLEGITIQEYDASLHLAGTASREGRCAAGAWKRCTERPVFSVTGPFDIATCADHLISALREEKTTGEHQAV